MEEVRSYQLHLVGRNYSWTHVNQVACALRFFYGITLGQKEAFERIVNGREPEKLPPVLGAEEIAQFLAAVAGLRNRVALTTSYGRLKQMAHGLFFMRTSRTATSSGNNACHVAPRPPSVVIKAADASAN